MIQATKGDLREVHMEVPLSRDRGWKMEVMEAQGATVVVMMEVMLAMVIVAVVAEVTAMALTTTSKAVNMIEVWYTYLIGGYINPMCTLCSQFMYKMYASVP